MHAIVAAFDIWRDLRSVLETITAEVRWFKAVLHGGKPAPDPALLEYVDEVAQIQCLSSPGNAHNAGAAANPQAATRDEGFRISAALPSWMSSAYASFVHDHIDKGRLLLWMQPTNPGAVRLDLHAHGVHES